MKRLAYTLVAVGFLGGAFVTALDVTNVDWPWFVAAALAAVVGVVLAKRTDKARAMDGGLLESNRAVLDDALKNLLRHLEQRTEVDGATGQSLLDWIDSTLRPDMRRFVEARESMVHLYGLQAYADIMSEFAAGERYINRVWSSMADGYVEEAMTYLDRAKAQFADAQRLTLAANTASA
ncbi:MAG: hypothetical protein AAAFM81_00940 [Pseudomonadota bacterium]